MLDEQLKEGTGGLAELNTILDSTQTKINKLKVSLIPVLMTPYFLNR